MRRFGLADLLGLVGALVAVVWLPGASDPLTLAKLLVLAGGGLAVAPAVAARLRYLKGPYWPWAVTGVAAVALVGWGAVSSIGSGAPVWNSVFGWWGRGDGWLAWLGSLFLFLGAATLSTLVNDIALAKEQG